MSFYQILSMQYAFIAPYSHYSYYYIIHISILTHWHIGTLSHYHISTLANYPIGILAHYHIITLAHHSHTSGEIASGYSPNVRSSLINGLMATNDCWYRSRSSNLKST